jgi:hypothetical protein
MPITNTSEGIHSQDARDAMPERDCGQHCPFLNRSDVRCSSHFSLDRLEDAFEDCFGDYKACPMYAEMLRERTDRRRATAAVTPFHGGSHPGYRTDGQPTTTPRVQLTLFPAALARVRPIAAASYAAHAHP